MREGCVIDFVRDAFDHLKAISFTPETAPLLDAAPVDANAGVVDLSTGGKVSSRPLARDNREPNVRTAA